MFSLPIREEKKKKQRRRNNNADVLQDDPVSISTSSRVDSGQKKRKREESEQGLVNSLCEEQLVEQMKENEGRKRRKGDCDDGGCEKRSDCCHVHSNTSK